jgi:hypothetical protein
VFSLVFAKLILNSCYPDRIRRALSTVSIYVWRKRQYCGAEPEPDFWTSTKCIDAAAGYNAGYVNSCSSK